MEKDSRERAQAIARNLLALRIVDGWVRGELPPVSEQRIGSVGGHGDVEVGARRAIWPQSLVANAGVHYEDLAVVRHSCAASVDCH